MYSSKQKENKIVDGSWIKFVNFWVVKQTLLVKTNVGKSFGLEC
jgi:hypothetical protein